jgi:hypothetical protein
VNLNLSVFWTLVVLAIGTPVLMFVMLIGLFMFAGDMDM